MKSFEDNNGFAIRECCELRVAPEGLTIISNSGLPLPMTIHPTTAYVVLLLDAGYSLGYVLDHLKKIVGSDDKAILRNKLNSMLYILAPYTAHIK